MFHPLSGQDLSSNKILPIMRWTEAPLPSAFFSGEKTWVILLRFLKEVEEEEDIECRRASDCLSGSLLWLI